MAKTILGVKLYDRSELRAMLGVSPVGIANLIKAGHLPHVLIGGKHWYSEAVIIRFLNGENQRAGIASTSPADPTDQPQTDELEQ